MKTISILLLIGTNCFGGVVVTNPRNVTVDAQPARTVCEAVAANPARAAEIQTALEAWIQNLRANLNPKLVKRIKDAVAANNSTELNAAISEAELPTRQQKIAEIDKQISDLQAKKALLSP